MFLLDFDMRRPRSAPPSIGRKNRPAPNRFCADDCSSDSESDEEILMEKLEDGKRDCDEWRRLAFHETQKLNYRRVHQRERPYYDQCHMLYAPGEEIDQEQYRALKTYPTPTLSEVDCTGVRSSTPPPREVFDRPNFTQWNDLTEVFRRQHPKRLVTRYLRLKQFYFRQAHRQSRLNNEIREKQDYDNK